MRYFAWKAAIDGQGFDTLGLDDKLISLEFYQDEMKTDMVIIDLWNENYRLTDSNIFRERATLDLHIGNGGPMSFVDRFILEAPKFLFSSKDVPIIRLIAFGEAILLKHNGEKRKSFKNMTDSEIAQQIATENGLFNDITTTSTRRTQEVQLDETDLEFLARLAYRNGYLFYVEQKTLHFHPIRYNKSLEEIGYRQDTENDLVSFRPTKVLVETAGVYISTYLDKLTGIAGYTQAADVPDVITTQDLGTSPSYRDTKTVFPVRPTKYVPPVEPGENATVHQNLVNVLQQRDSYLICGDGKVTFMPILRARHTVKINNLGHLSGLYYLKSLRHKYVAKQGAVTHFKGYKNRFGNLMPVPAVGPEQPNTAANPSNEIQPDIIGEATL